jgi:hypothetical protein
MRNAVSRWRDRGSPVSQVCEFSLTTEPPVPLRHALTNHTVSTAYDMGWANLDNGALLKAAETRFDALITTDRNLRYHQNLTGATTGNPGAAYDALAENSSSRGASFCRGQRAPSRRFRSADLLEPKPTESDSLALGKEWSSLSHRRPERTDPLC